MTVDQTGGAMAYDVMEISVVNDSHAAGWLAAATRVGEVYMSNVATMVTNVLDKVGENGLIERLNVLDHGNNDGIWIGKDYITVKSLSEFEATLAKLRPKFSGEGFVHFQQCDIGQNLNLLRALAKIFGVPVYAGTGSHNPIYRFNTGDYVVCMPGGTCKTNVPRP
jgi:hypothetical protein